MCVSSLRGGHANLLCIVPILTDDPRRESTSNIKRFKLAAWGFVSGNGSEFELVRCSYFNMQCGGVTASLCPCLCPCPCLFSLFQFPSPSLSLSLPLASFHLFILHPTKSCFLGKDKDFSLRCNLQSKKGACCPIFLSVPMSFADGHTASNAPDLFRPPKLSGAGPGQYWGGGPPGKTLGCCQLSFLYFQGGIKYWELGAKASGTQIGVRFLSYTCIVSCSIV